MGNKPGGLGNSQGQGSKGRDSLSDVKKTKNVVGLAKPVIASGTNGTRQTSQTSPDKQQWGGGPGRSGGGSVSPKGKPSTAGATLDPASAPVSSVTPPPTPSKVLTTTTLTKNPSDGDFSHYDCRLTVADFDLLKVLGKGSFGKVMLVKKKDDPHGSLYALKTLRKAALVKRNQLAHTSTERKILQDIQCPFLVHLVFAFQTADKLYMVLDYMGGGELFFWLKKEKRFSEPRCRLYAAEISLALEALHSTNIVYRDLKPENILLDSVGHLRLTDFGLAKSGVNSYDERCGTKTFCGTPEYLAPEILENKGHGKAVDWWALGTLLYEILTGLPPFYDQNVHKMYQKILHDPLKFPKGETRALSNGAKDILARLLERKISLRLGSNGIPELQESEFFLTLDFDRVVEHGYTPEFRPPEARSETDVRNFDREFTSETAADSLVVSAMTSTMQEKSNFEGFTYVPRGGP